MDWSGKDGSIAGVAAVRQWSISEGYSLNTAVHSGSAGLTDRDQGIYDWSGSASGYGATLPYMPGQIVSASFFKGPNAAGLLTAGEILAGSIYVDQLVLNWDFEKNARLNWSMNFGGNGVLSFSSGARPVPPAEDFATPCAGKFEIITETPSTYLMRHVKSATLTFTRPAIVSVNSGDAVGANKCLTTRKKGPALDWTLAITSDDSNEAAELASGLVRTVKAYVDATRFYELKWGIFGQRSNISVDIETGKIIGQTYNLSMKGFLGGVAGDVKNLSSVSMV